MKDRIKLIRKELKETQLSFAKKLNVSKSTIEAIEYGRRIPTDRIIADICRVYDVNEEWLRSGDGEMFVKRTKKEAITDFFAEVLNDDPDEFRINLISALAELPIEEWEMLANLCEKIVKDKEGK